MTINDRRWAELDKQDQNRLFARSELDISEVESSVADILNHVKKEGDAALRHYGTRFDKAPKDADIRVPEADFIAAESEVSPQVKEALAFAIENVRRFHKDQEPDELTWKEIRPGVMAGERSTPISSAGFYVPRARGSFPSMLYMLAVPAKIAGVPRVCVASPPDAQGKVDPACLVAARLCGVDEVYAMGGAQAWGAFAYGTETVARVAKAVGPGSKYVAAAKRLLGDVLDCGLPAGPSESIILADSTANPRLTAQDLLVEAEHGSDSAALLITDSNALADAVAEILPSLVNALPEPRKTFVSDVLAGYGGILRVESLEEGAELTNRFATEHLQIRTADPFATMGLITNAGEILLGENVPFSVANYAVGANAVLPTGGKAVTWSGVSVRDFKKRSGVVYLTKDGLDLLKGPAATLAEYEEFPAHRRALTDR